MKKVKLEKISNVSKQWKPIMNRLQKYSLGSKSLAVVAGVLGITGNANGNLEVLDLSTFANGSINAAGTGTLGNSTVSQYFTQSATESDVIRFRGFIQSGYGSIFSVSGFTGESLAYINDQGLRVLKYFSPGDYVNSSSTFTTGVSRIYNGNGNYGDGRLGAWSADRPSGAIGFKNGDGEFGYIRVSWIAATATMTFLSGVFDNTPNTAITVTAVPESSEYAAALGLGALGLAYYRRRPGTKTRPKNY